MLRTALLLTSALSVFACDDGDGTTPPAADARPDSGPADATAPLEDARAGDAQAGDLDGALLDATSIGDAALEPEPAPRDRHVDLIRGDRFPKLVIEVDAVPGTLPDMAVFGQIVMVLDEVLDKPGGIEVVFDGELESRGADYRWPFDEVEALERATDDLAVDADTITIHMLFVDGQTEQDTDRGALLGQAWRNKNIVIYRDNVEEACDMAGGGFPLLAGQVCDAAYVAVLTHEIGHVIGLVRAPLELTSDHEDADHPHHDIDPECVMYYAYEGSAAASALGDRFLRGDESAPRFDAACLADIAAVRED